MKRLSFLTAGFLLLFVSTAFALTIDVSETNGENSLQTIFDSITVGGSSSVDVTTDYIEDNSDSYWGLTASGGSVATMIIELAGHREHNIFGVYSGSEYVDLFDGSAGSGDQVTLSIKLDGSVWVNGQDTGTDFSGNNFGYYLDASYYNENWIFHSDTSKNFDELDHMAAYQGKNIDTVQIPGYFPGSWTDNEYILAFEDLPDGATDFDYNDMVVMVESVQPVPEPATMMLLGAGLIGFAGVSRKKWIKK